MLRDTRSQQRRVEEQARAAQDIKELLDANVQLEQVLADPALCDGHAVSSFYDALRSLRDYHARFPHLAVSRPSDSSSLPAGPAIAFSGAERYGRHLDLHELYDSFLNLSRVKARRERDPQHAVPSYREYCGSFFEFDDSMEGKDADYLSYVRGVAAYLVDFLRRSQPLMDVANLVRTVETDSARQYDDGSFRSWGGGEGGEGEDGSADPLYCVPCATRFAKQGTFDGHLRGKKHQTAVARQASGGGAHRRAVFLAEVLVSRLSDALAEVVQATIADIEKKQSRTLREQLDAMDEASDEEVEGEDGEEAAAAEEAEEEQGFVKQIKNYPVGWDGEPIPYWLYRLHGLGVEYKCEICGNTSYWGRRAFEKHFEEFRHQNGMRLLGLPNTAHFFEIVRIKDAVELHRKLEADKQRQWKPDEEMEMEDDQGRVYDRKTFELLRKQGVIRDKKT